MATEGFTEREGPTQLFTDVVISRVQPSSISEHPKFLHPSVYDMLNLDIYMSSILLYRMNSTDPSAFSNFIHTVKSSLSQVLSLYYSMAGKWIVAEDAWIRKLLCDDGGAVFVEAAFDDEMDNVVNRDNFNPPEELTGEHAVPGFEATSGRKTSETKEFPSLIVQVTRFKCGGVALTLNFNHMTADGYAFDRFLKAWSEILSTGQTSAKPVFDRSSVPSHLDKKHILGFPADAENLDDVLSSYFKSDTLDSTVPGNGSTKVFSVRRDGLERLRQRAKKEHGTSDSLQRPERFSTFECVSAQLWLCFVRIARALGGTSSEDMIRIQFPVEGRRKWCNPPLPEDYVGNVALLAGPAALPGLEVTDNPISLAASHIHESVVAVNRETAGERLDELMKSLKEGRSAKNTLKTEEPDNHNGFRFIAIASWYRFDSFYNLDFGYGCPFLASPFFCWAGSGVILCYLLCPPPDSDIALEMYLCAPPEYINLLREDPEFMDLVS